ncbi:hypothetical protein MKI84_03070 [Ancylobacter sp. A5.8]|uniref:hypothetical protein n=1 Tax=Ancylobacter gelatini TaxID=2919920 RepID=UPI001F4DB5A6|nr:hypothetical protein [Ancylobacter gelatini]MCJ8141887.1 hypothetical protein [Ancylobacter gelatini]
MKRMGPVAAFLVGALAVTPAWAGSTTIGGTVTTERDPDHFGTTKSTDWDLSLSHVFDNNVVISGGAKYYDTAHTSDYKVNVQAAIGYTHKFDKLSLTGMAGIGQHFIENDDSSNFTYYYFTVSAEVPLTQSVSWTIARLRYRNAFDTANDYDTPEIATGLNFHLDAHNTLTVFVERDWTDGEPSYNGLEFGFKHSF